jgi:hypothetical protein
MKQEDDVRRKEVKEEEAGNGNPGRGIFNYGLDQITKFVHLLRVTYSGLTQSVFMIDSKT